MPPAIARIATPKPQTLPAIHPNEGLAVAYRQKLEALVDDMHASLLWWLRSAYRANTPEVAQLAQDESPADVMRKAMKALAKQWQGNFDREAPELGKWFAKSSADRTDKSLQAILKRAGFTVKFTMTRAANDILQATTTENVGLIKSIASQHLSEVEGMVMRSVAAGRDLATLTNDLEKRYGITRKRASFIAIDQNNRATSTLEKARQEELGITEAKWAHSRGAKHPRPSHVAADGTIYKVAEGCFIDGEYIWPKSKINCGCLSRSIIPGRTPRSTEEADRGAARAQAVRDRVASEWANRKRK